MKKFTLATALISICLTGLAPTLMAQVGRVSGLVTDDQGNPLKDVQIRIEGMDIKRNYKLKTGKDGKFIHAGVVVQGRYRVIAEKEGYQTDYVEGVKPSYGDDAGFVEFKLKPGEGGLLAFEISDEERAKIEKQNEEARKQREAFEAVKSTFEAGMKAYDTEDYELAASKFKEAAAEDATQKAVWANLGNAQAKLGQNQEAVESYKKAIALDPQDAALHQNLGNLYSTIGKTDLAKASYEKAATLGAVSDPTGAAVTYYNLGVTYINENKTKEAAEALQKALEYDETYAEAHYQLGLTWLGLGQMEDAVKHLKRYLELTPNGPNAATAQALIESLGG